MWKRKPSWLIPKQVGHFFVFQTEYVIILTDNKITKSIFLSLSLLADLQIYPTLGYSEDLENIKLYISRIACLV